MSEPGAGGSSGSGTRHVWRAHGAGLRRKSNPAFILGSLLFHRVLVAPESSRCTVDHFGGDDDQMMFRTQRGSESPNSGVPLSVYRSNAGPVFNVAFLTSLSYRSLIETERAQSVSKLRAGRNVVVLIGCAPCSVAGEDPSHCRVACRPRGEVSHLHQSFPAQNAHETVVTHARHQRGQLAGQIGDSLPIRKQRFPKRIAHSVLQLSGKESRIGSLHARRRGQFSSRFPELLGRSREHPRLECRRCERPCTSNWR